MASPLATWEEERIPVAAERPRRRRSPRHGVVDATDAGLTFIVVLGLLATGGAVVGGLLGLSVSGAILGATIGLPLAFAATYLRYRNL